MHVHHRKLMRVNITTQAVQCTLINFVLYSRYDVLHRTFHSFDTGRAHFIFMPPDSISKKNIQNKKIIVSCKSGERITWKQTLVNYALRRANKCLLKHDKPYHSRWFFKLINERNHSFLIENITADFISFAAATTENPGLDYISATVWPFIASYRSSVCPLDTVLQYLTVGFCCMNRRILSARGV
jgi:hypothetical protein